jgi:hypothetical protein
MLQDQITTIANRISDYATPAQDVLSLTQALVHLMHLQEKIDKAKPTEKKKPKKK